MEGNVVEVKLGRARGHGGKPGKFYRGKTRKRRVQRQCLKCIRVHKKGLRYLTAEKQIPRNFDRGDVSGASGREEACDVKRIKREELAGNDGVNGHRCAIESAERLRSVRYAIGNTVCGNNRRGHN